jgi:hypothetical protein
MNKPLYWLGLFFCGCSEILFILAFSLFAFGRWLATDDKKQNESPS